MVVSDLAGERLAGEAFWVAFGQGIVALGIVVNLIVPARLLQPDQYGIVALGLAVSAVFQQALWGPLGNALSRYYSSSLESGSAERLLKEGFRFVRFIAAVSIGVAALAFIISRVWEVSWLEIIPIAVVLSAGYGYTSALDGLQNAARRRRVYAAHQVFGQLVRLGFTTSLLLLVKPTGIMVLVGYALGSMVTSITGSFLVRRLMRVNRPETRSADRDWRRTLAQYAIPFALWGLVSGLQAASDRWSLRAFCTGEAVGIYGAAYQLGYYPVVLVGTAVSQLVMPVIFQKAGDGTDPLRLLASFRAITSLTRTAILVVLASALICTLVHGPFFGFFFGGAYLRAAPLWPVSVASGGLFVAGQFASAVPYALGKSRLLIVPFAGTALIGICLNFAGALLAGLEGVTCGVLLTSLLYFIGPVLVARRIIATAGSPSAPSASFLGATT